MTTRAHRRKPLDPLTTAVREHAVAEIYRGRQVQRAIAATADRPSPLGLDARGSRLQRRRQQQRRFDEARIQGWLLRLKRD